MKERPILFSAPMVRAILEGRKTQTRRAISPQPLLENVFVGGVLRDAWVWKDTADPAGWLMHRMCPHGHAGDRLWVRESFSGPWCMEAQGGCAAVPPSKWGESSRLWYWADGEPTWGDWTRPRPSIHMPRWASRILLEVTAVRVERLQDISEADAEAEGIQEIVDSGVDHDGTPLDAYRALWESLNGAESWVANPWVWVIEFRRAA